MGECLLWRVLDVEPHVAPHVAQQRLIQGFAGLEAMRVQNRRDTAVEALAMPLFCGLRSGVRRCSMSSARQSSSDMLLALSALSLPEQTIRKRLAVVGQTLRRSARLRGALSGNYRQLSEFR